MISPTQNLSRLAARGFRYLPTNLISRAWGKVARAPLSRHLIRPYASMFRIATGEAEKPVDDYATLCEFFTRRLKDGSRTVDPDPAAVVSPVDCRVTSAGTCESDQLLQVKGVTFDLFSLLRDGPRARLFEDGTYAILYLSPQDYHRIHAPVDLEITSLGYMPGPLLPVNPPSVRWVPQLYAQNERVMIYADSPAGAVALVLVGAQCVGSIRLTFSDFATNRKGQGPLRVNFDRPISVRKGEEVGAFEMGSTVVLLFEKNRIRSELPENGGSLCMGQRIGSLLERSQS
jgi:phosphatidylserine decarboxylase